MTNTISKIGLVITGAILAVASYGLLATTQVDAKGRPGAANGTIAAIALANPNFSVLVDALTCTGLVGLVDGNRQLTVFAPTNDAFYKLDGFSAGDDICEYIGDNDALANILAYHVTPGVKTSQTVLNRSSMNMLNRQMAPIVGASIGGADLNVDMLNIRATNGVVHVLNDVMLP